MVTTSKMSRWNAGVVGEGGGGCEEEKVQVVEFAESDRIFPLDAEPVRYQVGTKYWGGRMCGRCS